MNIFNSILSKVIFKELWVVGGQLSQLFPFVHVFYVLVIIPFQEIFLSSFYLLVCSKAIRLLGFFFCSCLILCFALLFKGFSFLYRPFFN